MSGSLKILTISAAIALVMPVAVLAAQGDTVNAIKARGELNCGVSTGVSTGMSTLDNAGNWRGMEVEFCRGVAAAISRRSSQGEVRAA